MVYFKLFQVKSDHMNGSKAPESSILCLKSYVKLIERVVIGIVMNILKTAPL